MRSIVRQIKLAMAEQLAGEKVIFSSVWLAHGIGDQLFFVVYFHRLGV